MITGRRLLFPEGPRTARPDQVIEASKMLWIEASSVELNSSSDCCAERPSLSALEKLAIMPWFRPSRALASSLE